MNINNVGIVVYDANCCYTYCFLMLPDTFFQYPLKSNTIAIFLKENLQQMYEYFNKLMAAEYNYFVDKKIYASFCTTYRFTALL